MNPFLSDYVQTGIAPFWPVLSSSGPSSYLIWAISLVFPHLGLGFRQLLRHMSSIFDNNLNIYGFSYFLTIRTLEVVN